MNSVNMKQGIILNGQNNLLKKKKNYTHVRRPLGYLRYDTEEELKIINDLYGNELRLYKNFFQPAMKLLKKERVDGRLKRVYDIAKTPYQRLIESGQLSKEQEKSLKKLYRGFPRGVFFKRKLLFHL